MWEFITHFLIWQQNLTINWKVSDGSGIISFRRTHRSLVDSFRFALSAQPWNYRLLNFFGKSLHKIFNLTGTHKRRCCVVSRKKKKNAPLGESNYRSETKSDKEILNRSIQTSPLPRWGGKAAAGRREEERGGEKDALLKGLWVLSHYRLLRCTCCERTALPQRVPEGWQGGICIQCSW